MTQEEHEIAQDRIKFFGFFQVMPARKADLTWFLDKRAKANRLFSEPGLFGSPEVFNFSSSTTGIPTSRLLIAYPCELDSKAVLSSKLFKYCAELVSPRFDVYVYKASHLNIAFPHSEPLDNYSTIVFIEKQRRQNA